MKALFGLMPAAEFVFGVLFGIVYAQGYEPRRAPLGQGMRYGLIMGLMLAPMNSLVWYVILPIPQSLCAAWFVAGFVEMLVLGIVASFVYKPAQ
jgi:ABC-type multidrug transport system permease subunit